MTYLDWASTSPPDLGLLVEAAELAARSYGNPSSRHGPGQEARAALDAARARLGAVLGCPPGAAGGAPGGAGSGGAGSGGAVSGGAPGGAGSSGAGRVVFTSGGSEADAIVLLAALRKRLAARSGAVHVVASSIEHSAVYEELRLLEGLGLEASFVDPGPDGLLSPASVAGAMRKETALVAVMAVNNETGAVQPIAAIAKAVQEASKALGRRAAPHLHSDAVQALGKLPFEPAALGLSSAAFSAHKLRGPRGAGALWLGAPLEPLQVGGGQEGGLRPGTESLQGAHAFSRAAESADAALEANLAHARTLEARLLDGLARIPGALALPLGRTAGDGRYSPFILSAAFPGLSGEVLARALADEGIAVSTGAACSANARKKGRRVLEAMGLEEGLGFSAIRVSTGPATAPEEIDRFLETADALYRRLKT